MKTTHGLYHGEYKLNVVPSQRTDNKRAFIIPGQGAAYPGMFREFLDLNEDFSSVFRFADESSGLYDLLPVSTYIRNPGALPQTKMHVYRNCALYASEVAMGRILFRKNVLPDAITGHSFGECAGLVLAGIFSFEDMFHIVVHRNLLCPPANELGFMVTLNGTEEKLSTFLALDGVYLANRNSPKQLVVSIANDRKDDALNWLRDNRIPHIVLHGLPQPYHSPLMEPYRKKLHDRISKLKFAVNRPTTPFFSGIIHQWITEQNYSQINFTDLLARQLTEPVDFIQQIESLKEMGCSRFYEVGPGKMLEPPMKTILGEKMVVYRNVEALLPKDLDQKQMAKPQNEAMKKSRWFGKIKDVLHTVTGYKTDDIDIAHSFQNDLGIDSIKKAEILVKIIKEENLNTSSDFSVTRFSTIYEAVEYLENYTSEEDPLKITHTKKVVNVTPVWEKTNLLSIKSLQGNRPILRIPWSAVFLRELPAKAPSVVIIDCNKSSFPEEDFLSQFHETYQDFLKGERSGLLHFCLLDRTPDERFFPVASFLRSLAKESRTFTVSWIHDPEQTVTEEILRNEFAFSHIRDIRYEGTLRWVKNFRAIDVKVPIHRPPQTILALGGSRGINFEILRRFPATEKDKLILVGRTKATDPVLAAALKILSGVWKNFSYISADLENAEETLSALRPHLKTPVTTLLNAAGKEVSRNFEERDLKDILAEENSKLLPVKTIRKISQEFSVAKIINFSSIVSQFGNKGQAVYAWSNARLEQETSPETTALAWGPWEDVGMTTNLGILQKIREWGVSLISPEEGSRLAIQLILTEEKLPSVILPMDLKDVFLLSAEHNRTPVLGKLQDNFESVFVNEIMIVDAPFLEDHIILGKKVLPVAWLLSQLLAYGRGMFSKMTAIENFHVHNMLFLEDEKFSYKLQIFPRAPFEVNVWSFMKNADGVLNPSLSFSSYEIAARKNEKEIDLTTFYDTETFGPRFQFMKHAYVDENQNVRVEARMNENPVLTGSPPFDFWLYLLDLALQSISLQVKTVTGGVTMPVQFERLIFTSGHIETGSRISIYPEIHHQTDREGLASVIIANENNIVLCRLENVSVRKHFLRNRLDVKVVST